MQIVVNDESRKIESASKIADLLKSEGLTDQICAVALNGVFVPKNKHKQTILSEGDMVEIVSPREGG